MNTPQLKIIHKREEGWWSQFKAAQWTGLSIAQQKKRLVIIFGLLLMGVSLDSIFSASPLISLLFFIAPVLVVAAVCFPQFALGLVFLCANFPALVLSLPGHHMHLVEPASALCLLVTIIRHPGGRFTLSHLLAGLFLAIAIISFLHVPELASSTYVYAPDKRLIALFVVFVVFFSGTFLVRSIANTAAFLTSVLIINMPLYLVGLGQVVGIRLSPLLEAAGAHNLKLTQGRLWGPFPWSVNFGMYLINLFAVALVCWLLSTRRSERSIGLLMTIATALEIIGSGTRSVVLAGMIILIVALVVTRKFRLLVTLLALGLASSWIWLGRVLPLFLHDESSTGNRLRIWHEALKLILTNPWLGIGLQQFHHYYAQLIVGPATELGPQGIHPHEQYLEWAMESGLLWLLVGVLLLLSILFICWHMYRMAQGEQRMLLLVAILAILANGMIGFFDAPLDQLEGPVVLFLLAGLALGCVGQIREGRLAANRQNRAWWLLPLRLPARAVIAAQALALESQQTDTTDREVEAEIQKGDKKPLSTRTAYEYIAPQTGKQLIRETVRIRPDGTWLVLRRRARVGIPIEKAEQINKEQYAKFNVVDLDKFNGGVGPMQAAGAPTLQKTKSSIALQLLSWGVALPLLFPMTALLTRYLGPEKYGEYSLTFPFLTLFALLSGTGMDPLLIRELSRQPRVAWSKRLSYATGTRLVSTLLSAGAAACSAWLLPISTEQRNLFLLGSLSLLFSFSFNGLRIIYAHGFRAEQRIGKLCVLEAANRILTAGLVAVVVWYHLPLFWAYVLLVYSDIPAFFILLVSARQRFAIRLRFSWRAFKRHLWEGFPLTGHHILTHISGQIDLFLLLLIVGPGSVGIYGLASRITDPLLAIAMAYGNGLGPLLCRTFEERRDNFAEVYTQALRLLALATMPLAVVVSAEAESIVRWLGGIHFTAAAAAVQLLIWAMVITFLNYVSEQACIAAKMERRIPLITITTTCCNILFNLILIPRWQIIGAGSATLFSESIGLLLFTIMLRSHVKLVKTLGQLLRALANNLPAWLFLHWQTTFPTIVAIPLALLLTLLCYLITQTLTFHEIVGIKQLIQLRQGQEAKARYIDYKEEAQENEERYWLVEKTSTLILPQVRI